MGFFKQRLFVVGMMLPVFFFSVGVPIAEAGFGITPPYVRNTSLVKNSTYEQQILMVRGDANVAQKAQVTIDAPEIEDWIEIVEGDEIPLPRGEQKVPMTVRINVPDDADFKTYDGAIRIRTIPDDGEVAAGAVSISLGALVDINLTVIDREIRDFRVRKISVSELNEGKKLFWLFFPGKINFSMLLENTGNVDVAPTEVEMRIYDSSGKVLLEEASNIGRIDKVKPYATDTVVAEVPTRLPAGSYIARYKVFNGEEVKQEGDLSISIKPDGSVQAAGFGFTGLSVAHKISVLLPVFTILIVVLYAIKARRSRKIIRQ